jgi:hypothetical protein
MYTHLLTSGCSFTETLRFMNTPYSSTHKEAGYYNGRDLDHSEVMSELQPLIDQKSTCCRCGSWAPFLALELGIPLKRLTNYAMGSQGNQMIARNIVHGVEALLAKEVPVEDILVGVAWSGIDRGSSYSSIVGQNYFGEGSNKAKWMVNPVKFFEESERTVGWKIYNHHWASPPNNWTSEPLHEDSRSYYNVYNETSTFAIESAERIHWVQEYLNGKGIDYFFTNMSKKASIFGSDVDKISENHVRKTIELIDRSKFCEYLGIVEWQAHYMNTSVGPDGLCVDWLSRHPSTYSSYMYVKDQILPYLDKNYPTHT